VPWDRIVKGYEYEEDRYVILGKEDFRRANVEATQTVDIVGFVDADSIDPVYFDKPYYLAPTERGQKPYALLRETLRKAGKVGVAKVVIRTRQHLAAVIPRDRVLVLALLRFASEIRDPGQLDLPGDDLARLGVTRQEIQMAERLVEGLEEGWDPTRFRDEYRDDLLALIERKAADGLLNKVAPPPAVAEPRREGGRVLDLMQLLERSVEQQGQRAGADAAASGDRARRAERTKRAKRPPRPRRARTRTRTPSTRRARRGDHERTA
jgi:DNA end-binding protein Ku